jgi:hypothetical protein
VAVDDQGGDAPARIDLQVFGLALVARGEVEPLRFIGQSDLLERDVRCE